MKPSTVIVESVTARAEAAVRAAVIDLREAEVQAAKAEKRAEVARTTVAARRLELGKVLIEARKQWPKRGPNAKGWGEFLEREGIEQSTAWRMMRDAGYSEDDERGPTPDISCADVRPHENCPPIAAVPAAEVRRQDPAPAPISPPAPPAAADERAPESVPTVAPPKPANMNGGSGNPTRGKYCTPRKYADAVGPWDIDPFTNPHAHIVARHRCMLEVLRGGLGDPGGGSRGDRVGGGQSDRPGGGQSDRRNWSNHAQLGDQGAAKLIARGSRVAATVGARP